MGRSIETLVDVQDVLSINGYADEVLAALFRDAANVGFEGDSEDARVKREGFSHIQRLLREERKAVEDAIARLSKTTGA